jgi:hypothetical protein
MHHYVNPHNYLSFLEIRREKIRLWRTDRLRLALSIVPATFRGTLWYHHQL